MIDLLIKTVGPKKRYSNYKKCQNFIEKKRTVKRYKLPDVKFNSNISKELINQYDVYKLSNSNSNRVIIYLHGGAYINDANIFYFKFADKIASESKIDLYFPIYPLAPNYTYKDAYKLLLSLYNKLLESNKKIILMGDSAGGGFALAFTQYLKELNIKLPFKLILISPWVDISMSNPSICEYEKIDPILSRCGLVEIGKYWAGDLDVKDYKLSPIFGNLVNIPNTLLFAGENEILYPDICLLYDKLKYNGVNCEFVVGKNMNHDYPLYPFKLCKIAREKIIEYINN